MVALMDYCPRGNSEILNIYSCLPSFSETWIERHATKCTGQSRFLTYTDYIGLDTDILIGFKRTMQQNRHKDPVVINHTIIWICPSVRPSVCSTSPRPFTDRSQPNLLFIISLCGWESGWEPHWQGASPYKSESNQYIRIQLNIICNS